MSQTYIALGGIILMLASLVGLWWSLRNTQYTPTPTAWQDTFGGEPWQDTFGGPVDWGQH